MQWSTGLRAKECYTSVLNMGTHELTLRAAIILEGGVDWVINASISRSEDRTDLVGQWGYATLGEARREAREWLNRAARASW